MPRVRRRATIHVDAAPDVVIAAARAELELGEDLTATTESTGTITVAVSPATSGTGCELEVTAADDVNIPYFQWFFGHAFKRRLTANARYSAECTAAAVTGGPPPKPPGRSLFLPPVSFSERQAGLIAAVALAAVLAGFGSALFGQNTSPISDSFHVSDADLGIALAITRFGVLASLIATALADRRGRRIVLLWSLGALCVANLVSAVSPDIQVFTAAQLVVRASVNAVLVVGGIAVVEEAPEGARAFAVAMLGLAGGAGFALSVIQLPAADIGPEAWRIAFGVSALTALLIPMLARTMPETHRYQSLAARSRQRGRFREVVDKGYRKRFLLLAAVGFLTNVFSAPSAQLTNQYLSDDRNFSSSGIAGFRAVTAGIPGLFGILLAGRITETRGRRPVAVVSLIIGTLCTVIFFLGQGAVLWIFMTISIVAAAPAALAVGTMDAELFPTEVRGTSNALLLVTYVAGSVVGLVVAGQLSDPLGGIGYAIALCGIGPIIAAIFLVPRLPESRGQMLDDVSPSEV
jgi:AAHS family 4-hydroxybenzoate transporter-like MFS transporter